MKVVKFVSGFARYLVDSKNTKMTWKAVLKNISLTYASSAYMPKGTLQLLTQLSVILRYTDPPYPFLFSF